jgi:hypothetical protein
VPHGVFANDQHAPSVHTEGEKPPEDEEHEVMAVDRPPEPNLEDPDWHFPILEWLVEGKLPPTRRRLDASPAEQRRLSLSTASSTSGRLLAYSCSASLETRDASCYNRYMPAPADTTSVRERLSERLFDKVSTSPQRL